MKTTKNTIRLRKEHRTEVDRLLLLKQHHLMLAQSLDHQLHQLLSVGYGIDLARENWELGANGVLTRKVEEAAQ